MSEVPPAGPDEATDRAATTAGMAAPPAEATQPEPVPTPLWPLRALVIVAAVVALVAGLTGGLVGAWWQNRSDSAGVSVGLPKAPTGTVSRAPSSVAGVVRRVLPSVVTLEVTGAGAADTGSGFVLRSDGYVVTNNHVVAAAAGGGTISVVFSDGRSVKGTVIGSDASYDLAVVRVARKGLPELRLGESRDVVVGDPVIAVGAPLGLQGSVTTGIVSALNRPVTAGGDSSAQSSFINAIQTDAAINPGNSGGPLVNVTGDVIGVNSAIAQLPGATGIGAQSGSIGVGFAIPSDQVRITADQLIATGKASHPVIGVLLDSGYGGPGVRVATASGGDAAVTPGGAADRAGIKGGDVIITLDGQPVTDEDSFVVAIRAHAPGDVITLTVRTGKAVRTVKLTLQASTS